MKTKQNYPAFISLAAIFAPLAMNAQITSGVPEPGVIVYGRVLSSDGVTTLPPTSLAVSVKFSGQLAGKTIPVTVGPGEGGATYYVARLGFGNKEVIPGASNAGAGFPSIQFDYPASETTFNLTTTGGDRSRITSSGNTSDVSLPPGTPGNFGFPKAVAGGGVERGKLVRMDLKTQIAPASGLFEDYMAGFASLTGANATRTADPDGDAMTNEAEWLFGTDPTNRHSNKALHTLVVMIAPVTGEPDSRDITFTPKYHDGSRTYRIFSSTDLGKNVAWQPAAGIAVTDGPQIAPGVVEGKARDNAATPEKKFYQIEANVTGP